MMNKKQLIKEALKEDLGKRGDVTSKCLLEKSKKGSLIASLEILKEKGLTFNELINK